MGKFKAVFFDLDGTLWDNVACSDHVMETVLLPKLSRYLPDESQQDITLRFNAALIDVVKANGLSGEHRPPGAERFEHLLRGYGVKKPGLARELSTTYNAARRLSMSAFLRPSATEVLSRLGEMGMGLGLITNGSPAVQRQVVETLGLARYLDHMVIGELEGFYKPDPRLFQRALELADVRRDEMLYVGDSLITDVIGASRAGIPVAWLRLNDREIPANLPVPEHAITDLNEVLSIVAS